MAMLPINRIPEILKRMDLNLAQAEAMKTCFGILAIMSREDANKTLIAKDGMEIMLNAMTAHIDRTDVQEAGCDLLWSLAFNSGSVKEIIAKFNGAIVLVRALKRHTRSPDFLKSACGALSNICQWRINQEAVAAQGGLQPLVGSIHIHQTNAKLLPFIFDAIASIIVNNEENARTVSSLGIIPVAVATLSRHKASREVVKSGCHTLAILSDVKGQASKIAFAGGVPVILSLLDLHPLYSDLHRVAAVVLLRMLQESSHVGREICCHEGVRILLYSLEKGGAQQDTVAAVTHILYSITNPSLPSSSSIEPQLWTKPPSSISNDVPALSHSDSYRSAAPGSDPVSSKDNGESSFKQTSLTGVVQILGQYAARRDVVRAACRLVTNLSGFANVCLALDGLNVLEKIFICISIHRDTKDVLEAAVTIIKGISRWRRPRLRSPCTQSVQGLLHLFESRINDEEVVVGCADMCKGLLEDEQLMAMPVDLTAARGSNNEVWYLQAVSTCLIALNMYGSSSSSSSSSSSDQQQQQANSLKPDHSRTVNSLVEFLFLCVGNDKLTFEDSRVREVIAFLQNWSQRNEPERMNMFIFLEEKLRKKSSKSGHHSPIVSNETNSKDGVSTDNHPVGEANLTSNAHSENSLQSLEADAVKQRKIDSLRSLSRNSSNSSAIGNTSNNNQNNISKNGCMNTGTASSSNRSNSGLALTKITPQHPLKDTANNSNNNNNKPAKLLENWPNFLERLLTNSLEAIRFSSTLQDREQPTRMHICYESLRPGGKSLDSRCSTPIPYNIPIGGAGDTFAHSLTFDAEFESGNLFRAVQISDNVYDLILRADVHTQGHTQWFYFAVANTHPPELVRLAEQGVNVPSVRVVFNLINFTKPDSLFNLGMRPVVYSATDAKQKGIGWVRSGFDISYYGNNFARGNTNGEGNASYYTLTFTMEFHHPKDTVLIAYSYPYTLTDYRLQINQVLERPYSEQVIRKLKLCTSLAGEDCDLLVITDFHNSEKEKLGPLMFTEAEFLNMEESLASKSNPKGKELKALEKMRQSLKPALFLSARVHPGETPASWMMKGIIEFLTSDHPAAQQIRRLYIVFVVPILNPDGVTFGNNRCSLAGVDLNRQWKTPIKQMHPTIYYFKMYMLAQKRIRDVSMYIDLHGHSRKYNVFMYGCDSDKKKPKPQVRAFPRFLSQHSVGGKYVCFADCSFHVKKGRESTARVVVAKEMNIPCSFTIEATFCGSNYGPLKNCHMNIGHLQEVGAALCDAFLNFSLSEGAGKDSLAVPSGKFVYSGSMNNNNSNNNNNNNNASVGKQSSFTAARDSLVNIDTTTNAILGDCTAVVDSTANNNNDITAVNESALESDSEDEGDDSDAGGAGGDKSQKMKAQSDDDGGITKATEQLADVSLVLPSSRGSVDSSAAAGSISVPRSSRSIILLDSGMSQQSSSVKGALPAALGLFQHPRSSGDASSIARKERSLSSTSSSEPSAARKDFASVGIAHGNEDKGLDRVMELMYSSTYRDTVKLRSSSDISAPSTSGSSRSSKPTGQLHRGLAAATLELTGNKYQNPYSNSNNSSMHGYGVGSNGFTRLSATATAAEMTTGPMSEKRGNGSTIVKNEFHDFFGASAMVHNTTSEKSVVTGKDVPSASFGLPRIPNTKI